jgi:TolB-like protein
MEAVTPPTRDRDVASQLRELSNGRTPKKRKKMRAAWISFVGRIVAQVIGAAASVVIAVLVLERLQTPASRPSGNEADKAAPVSATAARTAGDASIAVLPFDNYSGDPAQDYFVNSLTEALIADFAQIDNLRVVSRTSVMRYRGERKSLPQIAGELNVDLVVEGSMVRAGDRVRITAQLIDATTDVHLWARTYDRIWGDVLTLQEEVATEVGKALEQWMSSSRPPHRAIVAAR